MSLLIILFFIKMENIFAERVRLSINSEVPHEEGFE